MTLRIGILILAILLVIGVVTALHNTIPDTPQNAGTVQENRSSANPAQSDSDKRKLPSDRSEISPSGDSVGGNDPGGPSSPSSQPEGAAAARLSDAKKLEMQISSYRQVAPARNEDRGPSAPLSAQSSSAIAPSQPPPRTSTPPVPPAVSPARMPVGAPSTPAVQNRTNPPPAQPTTPGKTQEEPPAKPPSSGDGTGSDHTAPVLEIVRFDPPEIRDGMSATLIIEATDDMSGVKAVSGIISSPSGASMPRFTAQKVGDGVFQTAIAIPKQAESGNWFLFSLEIVDGADNPMSAHYPAAAAAPPGGTLVVTSSAADSTAPTVHSATVQFRSIPGGEKNIIDVAVDDDNSGVAEVTGAFQNPSKSATIPFTCHQSDPATWEGEVPVPSTAECGLWRLYQIKVVDNAGNSAYLMNNNAVVSGVAFTVSNSAGCDSTPPALQALTLAPPVVLSEAGANVLLSATILEEGSGMQSMSGWMSGPPSSSGEAPRIFLTCNAAADTSWTCKAVVPPHAAVGTWRVGLIRLTDKAQNTRDYNLGDPATAQATFEVQ